METLLTIEEVAGKLKLAEQTIRRYVLKRHIPYRKIGKVVRFRPSEVDRWIDGGGMAASAKGDAKAGGLSEELPCVESDGMVSTETDSEDISLCNQ